MKRENFLKFLLLLNFILLNEFRIFGQLDTIFWFVAPEVVQLHGDRPIVFRFATLNKPAEITISQPANSNFPVKKIQVSANSSSSLDLTQWIDIVENKPANVVNNFGFKISSTELISAYYEVTPYCNCNPDIFTLKGDNSLGYKFITPFQNFLNNASYARSGFNIVATEDNTIITITPTNDIVGHQANQTFTIILNKGETYCAEASSTARNKHLSGSIIISNKKIAVTLHDDTLEGVPYGGCGDLMGDQLIPIHILGKEYIAIKGYLNGPDKVYIVSVNNNTSLKIDGTFVANLSKNETYTHTLYNNTAYIEASDSICVLHQSGFGCEVGEAVLPHIVCTGSNVVPFVRSTNEFIAMNILVPAGAEDGFVFNGSTGNISTSNFHNVSGTNNKWKYAQIDISNLAAVRQASRIENSKSKFHLGIIHGGSSSGCRYGYFSDFGLLKYQIDSKKTSMCEGDSIDLSSNILFNASYNWVGPNNFTNTGQKVLIKSVKESNSGWYKISGNLPNTCKILQDSVRITIFKNDSIVQNVNFTKCSSDLPFLFHNTKITTPGKKRIVVSNLEKCLDSIFYLNLTIKSFEAGTNLTICKSDSIKLNGSGGISYTWDNNVLDGVYFKPDQSRRYVVTGVDGNGCKDTSSLFVKVYQLPSINAGLDTSVCFGTSAELKAKGGVSYQWNNGIEDKKSFIPQETKVYKVIGTDVNGCKNSDEVEVKVNPNPEFVLSVTDPCEKQNLAFTVNLGAQTSLVGVKSSSWTGVSSFTSNELNPQILNVGLNQKGSYSITLTDNNNCQTQKSIIANVSPEDQIDFADLGAKCINDIAFNLPEANIIGGNWSTNDNTSIQDEKQGLFDPSKSKPNSDKKVDVTYSTTTIVPARKCPSQKTKTILIYSLPTINAGLDTSICFGTSAELKAKGGIGYQWDNGVEDNQSFIPQETKVYKVLGTDVNGCKNFDEVEVKVNPNPEFALSVTDPCEKQNLAFTLNLGAQTTSVGVKSSEWTGVLNFASKELNPQILNVGLNQKGSYNITLTDNYNCQTKKSITVNVSPEDQIDFADLGAKCVNDIAFNLPEANITGGTWSSNDFTSIQDDKKGLFDPSKSKPNIDKQVEVSYTTSTVLPARKCPSQITKKIIINSLPIIDGGIDTSVCFGTQSVLKAKGGISYQWDNGIEDKKSFIPQETKLYKVIGADVNGCKNSDEVEVKVNPNPEFVLSVTDPCEKQNLAFTVNLGAQTSLVGVKSSSWKGVSSFTSNELHPQILNVGLNHKGSYNITLTDNNNCQTQKSIIANVSPEDQIDFADLGTKCVNDLVFILPAPNIKGGSWSSSDNISIQDKKQGLFDPSKSKPDLDKKIDVTYTTSTVVPVRKCPSHKTKSIFINPIPDSSFYALKQIICEDDEISFRVVNPNVDAIYKWEFGNGESTFKLAPTYTYLNEGNYNVKLTSTLGQCVVTQFKKDYIHVIPKPKNIDFTMSVSEIDFYNPLVYFYTNTQGKYYQWKFGDGSVSDDKNPIHTYPMEPNTYLVTLKVLNMKNHCDLTLTKSILMPEPLIYFIPNSFTPNGDDLNFVFQPIFTYGYDPEQYSFYIYNRWGNLIFETHNTNIGWDGTFANQELTNDTYIWKLEFKEKSNNKKHSKVGHVNLLK